MRKNKFPILIFACLITFTNCKSDTKVDNSTSTSIDSPVMNKKSLTYKVQNKEKYETNNKAQLKISAYLTTEPTTKEDLENTVNEIYDENKNESGYKNFSSPTVIGIYLFTSEEKAKEMPDQWIAMLSKVPSDPQPSILVDELKFKSQSGLTDSKKSEDEIELEKLNKYLEQRGLELCTFYKQLDKMEIDCIHTADKKYPDFGIKHSEYSQKLMDDERNKMKNKYKLADDIFTKVAVFGMSYCK